MNYKSKLTIYLLLLMTFGSSLSYSEQERRVHYKVLESGQFGPHMDSGKQIIIINNENQFESEFNKYQIASIPNIDFERNVVVLINIGGKSSGGYKIDIEGIVDNNEKTTIKSNISSPSSSCNTASVMTNPYIFVEVTTTKDIVVKERFVTNKCEW